MNDILSQTYTKVALTFGSIVVGTLLLVTTVGATDISIYDTGWVDSHGENGSKTAICNTGPSYYNIGPGPRPNTWGKGTDNVAGCSAVGGGSSMNFDLQTDMPFAKGQCTVTMNPNYTPTKDGQPHEDFSIQINGKKAIVRDQNRTGTVETKIPGQFTFYKGWNNIQIKSIGGDSVWFAHPDTTSPLPWYRNNVYDTSVAGDSVIRVQCDNADSLAEVNLTANPREIEKGDTTTLKWTSVNMKSCVKDWLSPNDKTLSGTNVDKPEASKTYTLSCVGKDDKNYSSSVDVTVKAPPLTCATNEFACNGVCTSIELNSVSQVTLPADGSSAETNVTVQYQNSCGTPATCTVDGRGTAIGNPVATTVAGATIVNATCTVADPSDEDNDGKTTEILEASKTINSVCIERTCSAAGACIPKPVLASSVTQCNTDCQVSADCRSGNVTEVKP